MSNYISINNLKVDKNLYDFISKELLSSLDFEPSNFFKFIEQLVEKFTPINDVLIQRREELQVEVDCWCRERVGQEINLLEYKSFLQKIGYLEEEPDEFKINTSKIDKEISDIAGPQLVVPVNIARYALKAYNARWTSLYDCIYSSDMIEDSENKGDLVVAYVMKFIDEVFPLSEGSHNNITQYCVSQNSLQANDGASMQGLKNPNQYAGFIGDEKNPSSIILTHHNLHLILDIDKNHYLGKKSSSGIKDVRIESAISTIMDCEDSVAAVDGEDKTLVYRNWLGLVSGKLETSFNKGGKETKRNIREDISYINANNEEAKLKTRSLLLIRNVGHLMKTPAILYKDEPIYEGLLDAIMTTTASLYDIKNLSPFKNSRAGSIYVVKPKMHGREEVKLCCDVFSFIEECLSLEPNTIKIGIMDEERRTSLNLAACIKEAKHRVCFINTGFLDRTGDDIHTSFRLAPVPLKGDFKDATWLVNYEKNNVAMGLKGNLMGNAQIGKGMWAKTEHLKEMVEVKHQQLQVGAFCAWVPSPTAASLHAMHYFKYGVKDIQKKLLEDLQASNVSYIDDILKVATLKEKLNEQQIQKELENNAQGILGYCVRWIDQGIGCSKVPDINGIALMEDRATVRISSQHIANWLHHGIVSETQVRTTFAKMSALVDEQNQGDGVYQAMNSDLENSTAFKAALDLVLLGKEQPSGYTEPILHAYRLQKKQAIKS